MKCPNCNGDLKPGFMLIHGTGWGLLLNLWGIQQCYFRASEKNVEQTDPEEMVVPWSKSRFAYRCGGCKTLVIPGDPKQDPIQQ